MFWKETHHILLKLRLVSRMVRKCPSEASRGTSRTPLHRRPRSTSLSKILLRSGPICSLKDLNISVWERILVWTDCLGEEPQTQHPNDFPRLTRKWVADLNVLTAIPSFHCYIPCKTHPGRWQGTAGFPDLFQVQLCPWEFFKVS
jgi:hypothetical protein